MLYNHLRLRILRMNRRQIHVPLFCREFIHEPLLFDATNIAIIFKTTKAFAFFMVLCCHLEYFIQLQIIVLQTRLQTEKCNFADGNNIKKYSRHCYAT